MLLFYVQLWLQFEAALSLRRGGAEQIPLGAGSDMMGDEPEWAREKESNLHTLIIASPTPLLPTGTPKYIPAAGMFSLAGLDLKDLLSTAAKWQSGDLKRAVLLAGGGTCFAASGLASPPAANLWKQNMVQVEDSRDVWEDRAAVSQIAVGALTSPPTAPLSSLPRLPSIMRSSAANAAGNATAAGFTSLYQVEARGGLGSKSFWDVLPQKPSGVPGEGAAFKLTLCTDRDADTEDVSEKGALSLSIGPIIGKVCPSSVVILVESGNSGVLRLSVIDQVTGIEYTLSRRVLSQQARTYYVDGLLPRRPYTVQIDCDSFGLTDDSLMRVCGSFTTPSDARPSVPNKEHEQKILTETRMAAFATNNSNSQEIIHSFSSTGKSQPSAQPKFEEELRSSKSSVEEDVLRIVLVGAIAPAANKDYFSEVMAANMTTTEGAGQGETQATKYANERSKLMEGRRLLRLLSELNQSPWSPIDLTLHVGGAVDLSYGAQAAMGLLAQAESNILDPSFVEKQLSAAETFICDSYRMHWGADGVLRDLLLHGCHLPVSCPEIDLCRSLSDASCLAHLSRDYSPVSK